MIRILVALAILAAPNATSVAAEGDAVERELRRLNDSVARIAILMERMVVEQETTSLQQRLTIVEQRIRTVEERRTTARDRLRERVQERAELEAMLELVRKDVERNPDSAEGMRHQIGYAERRMEAVAEEIADLERRIADLDAREQENLEVRDRLERRLSARIGGG